MNLYDCGCFLLGIFVVASFAPTTSAYLRYEPVDDDYVMGKFTWNNGQGGISWDPEAPTEETAAVAHSYVFRSQPVPRTLHLNASRLIQLDLDYNNYSVCSRFQVIIDLDGQLVAGNTGALYDSLDAKFRKDGDAACLFRMQAEVDVIPKDAILRITITYDRTGCSAPPVFVYAGSGPCDPNENSPPIVMKASVLRLPIFSATDAVLRVGQLADARRDVAPPLNPADAVNGVVGTVNEVVSQTLGSALLLLAPLGRRRSPAFAVLLLAGMFALSGCVGGQKQGNAGEETPEATGGSIRSTRITGGNATPDGVGSIVGFVHTERRDPIGGATVWLVGYQFVRTDGLGKFALENIVARTYTLRVNATGFLVAESPVTVTPGDVQRVEVELEPIVRKAGDANWHPHDYWAGRDSVTVFDEDLSMDTSYAGLTNKCARLNLWDATGAGIECSAQVSVPLMDGNDDLVKPGTSDVEVIVSWEANLQNTASVSTLSFIANNELGTNQTSMVPKANGVSTHIRTGWEMTDIGHQQFSTWVFIVKTRYDGTYYALDQAFHLKIIIHRGVVPLEPGHREFWKGLDTFSVLEKAQAIGKRTEQLPGLSIIFGSGFLGPSVQASWIPANLTPPGTGWIDGTLQRGGGFDEPINWVLYAKTANSPPTRWYAGNPSYQAIEITPISDGWSFRHEVAADEADPFYAPKTGWEFFLDDGQDEPIRPTYLPGETQFTFTLTVVAHREAPTP